MITLIAAVDSEFGISKDGKVPWHLPEDFLRLRQLTARSNIIMGNNAFKTIGSLLTDRFNVVVTRENIAGVTHPMNNVTLVNSMDEAFMIAGTRDVFVLGGMQIYSLALPMAHRVLLTRIEKNFGCDSHFPRLAAHRWREVLNEPNYSSQNDFNYAYSTYMKV